jgi:hypothetical protein
MATPKVQIDNSKLMARMKRYEEVTGKEVAASLRRGARLLAVNMAISTQPYGKGLDARKKGEAAIGKDLLRIFYVMHPANIQKFIDFWGSKKNTFKFGHKGAAPIGDVTHQVLSSMEMKGWHKSHRLPGSGRTRKIKLKDGLNVLTTTGIRFRDLPGLDVGIVSQPQFDNYVKYIQLRVGMTKAAWGAAALQVNADVKDALSGLPAWVKRHIGKVPSAVVDKADSIAPTITLTNKIPWADNSLREPDKQEAIRISREKFYKSMGTEIRFALKKAQEEKA